MPHEISERLPLRPRLTGVGYWSGRDIRVEFRPASAGTGIVFVRSDMKGCPRIPATIENRFETPRRTTLRCGEAAVEMVEHLMAALAGLQIDNCELWVDQPEMPGCDGSSLPFVEILQSAGIVEQDVPRPQWIVGRPIRVGNAESWIEARPCRSGKLVLRYELDYGSGTPIGRQSLEVSLSPRHFHVNGAEPDVCVGVGGGGDQGPGAWPAGHVPRPVGLRAQGPIDNRLRFPDECVRHKMVDMVGDLALAGRDVVGRVTAYRSGHRLNAELVRAIVAEGTAERQKKHCAVIESRAVAGRAVNLPESILRTPP